MSRPTARHVPPGSTHRGSAGVHTADPYSTLLQERIVLLGTRIDDASANAVTAQLLQLERSAPGQDIHLYINSPGGSFPAMTAIHDTMEFVTCEVATVCVGQAVSAAAVLLAAGAPGKRLATPGARILIRRPSLDDAARWPVSDLESQARELLRVREQLETLLARHTGQDVERIRSDIERDTVFDAESAVAYGLVDRLTSSPEAEGPGNGPDSGDGDGNGNGNGPAAGRR